MHPRAIAQRNANATNRTRIAADRIAEALGIDPLEVRITPHGGPLVAQLQLREAIADYLERIAGAVEGRGDIHISEDINLKPRRESRNNGKGAAVTATEGDQHDGTEAIREQLPALPGNA